MTNLKKTAGTVLAALCLMAAFSGCDSTPKEVSYTDKTQPAEARARDLLSKLSLEEKAGLVQYNSPAVERLGIKAYNWWSEALHGVARNGSATVFPQPIGMAASFDVDKIETVFTAVSDEHASRIARRRRTAGYTSMPVFPSGPRTSTSSAIPAGAAEWKHTARILTLWGSSEWPWSAASRATLTPMCSRPTPAPSIMQCTRASRATATASTPRSASATSAKRISLPSRTS